MTPQPITEQNHQQWVNRIECENEPEKWQLIVRTFTPPAKSDESGRQLHDPDPVVQYQVVIFHEMGYILRTFQPFVTHQRYLEKEMTERFPDCIYTVADDKLERSAPFGFSVTALTRHKATPITPFGSWVITGKGGFYHASV